MPNINIRLSAQQFIAVMVGTTLALLGLLTALPHDRYIRFQNLVEPAVVKATWIYERIHFDPTPIDVVFIGTSHTVFGVNDAEIERTCRAAGGQHCASVNFALQHLGRNTHWLLAREVLETRKPRLLVIEVTETEPRAMHPAFPYLADASDIVSAPLVINTSFFNDLVRLPLRNLSLFVQSLAPSQFDVRHGFDLSHYRGAQWNDTYAELGSYDHPVDPVVPRTTGHTAAELEYQRSHPQSTERIGVKLPAVFKQFEYRATLLYLAKILALAREKGVEIRFLYLPSFRASSGPAFAKIYRSSGPLSEMPQDIRNDPNLWSDVDHLNFAGARRLSEWLGREIAKDAAGK